MTFILNRVQVSRWSRYRSLILPIMSFAPRMSNEHTDWTFLRSEKTNQYEYFSYQLNASFAGRVVSDAVRIASTVNEAGSLQFWHEEVSQNRQFPRRSRFSSFEGNPRSFQPSYRKDQSRLVLGHLCLIYESFSSCFYSFVHGSVLLKASRHRFSYIFRTPFAVS